ncbi:hypothetical protein Tco_0598410 [Tanacetum coccineum]
MVKNVDNVNKFLMYPRFVQMFMNQQAGDMSNHKRIYVTASHTKKVFGNMKREGKGFSGRVTPLFSSMMVQAQQVQGKGLANPTDPQHTHTIAQPSSSQPQKKHKPRKPKNKDTQIPKSNVPSDNIAEEAINKENVPTHSNDPLLSGEDRLKLEELMALCTNLQNRVLDLEHTKTTQALEIDNLKRRVKKLKKKQRSRTHGLRRLYKVGLSVKVISSEDEGLGKEDASKHRRKIHDIDADEDITLENVHDADIIIPVSAAKDLSNVDITLAQALAELKSAKPKAVTTAATTTTTVVTRPKAKGLDIQDQEQASTPITSSKDKGKGIMVEEPLKMKKKDQVLFDEQEAIRLQAQFNEEERIAREKEEANVALIAQWNDIQDKVDTNYELAQRLQAEEQEELTIEEKSKLFQQLLEKRRKHFAAKRADERRNRPPKKSQNKGSIMVNTFVDMDTELVGGSEVRAKGSETITQEISLKRAGDELEQKNANKQKVDDDQETAELQSMMKIVPDEEEVVVDAIPLAIKPPSIIDYKIIKEGKISNYQIIRADGNSKRPEEGYERVLWGDLKTMFEHHVEDAVWRNL